ncbi:MAG: YihY/virulence factor BrkB family protein [Coriobacteriia bacterium]|nr:YihY/virulence factor BrkB family protein [Coriobacteriia bacterium]
MDRLKRITAGLSRRPEVRLSASALRQWRRHGAPRIAAAMAYYALMSMAPLMLVVVAVAGTVFEREAVRGEILRQAQRLLQPDALPAVEGILDSATRARPGAGTTLIAVGISLLGAAGVFVQLQAALNHIWAAPPPEGFLQTLWRRSLSFLMVAVAVVLLGAAALSNAALATLVELLPSMVVSPLLMQSAGFALSFLLVAAMFALVYKVLPDVDVSWRDALLGALVTAALFSLANLALGAYFSRTAIASAYGAAGSVAVLLLWAYLVGQVVLLGAEFTHVWACTHGSLRDAARSAATGCAERD